MIRWKIEEELVAEDKAKMNKSCRNDFSSLQIKCITDVTEITNAKKTRFTDTRDVVRHGKS